MVGLTSLVLLFLGEPDTAGVMWVVLFCLLPSMLLAHRTSYLSIKFFCATVLITQIISAPIFYLNSDSYEFINHRPFDFTILEALPVLSHLGVFLVLVTSFMKLSQGLFGPLKWNDTGRQINFTGEVVDTRTVNSQRQKLFIITILIIIGISLPVKFWMFDMGIGIVGTSPPRLPFRLSGVLTYLFGWIVPLIIGYLYIKTKRASILLASIIALYALMIGILSSSKAIVLLTTAPIVGFAWNDRRWVLMSISGLLASFGVMIVEASRLIVHISNKLVTESFTELGGFGTMFETLTRLEWSPKMFNIFVTIAGRVESFQGLFMAFEFNPDAVGGAFGIFIKLINNTWIDLGHDAIHLEYLGYTIPEGFHGVPASLNALMLMASNRNIFILLFFVIYTALILIILERLILRLTQKWSLSKSTAQAILFFATLLVYTSPGGVVFQFMLAGLVFFVYLPKIRLTNASGNINRLEKKRHF
jgi:hypothetical protein